MDSGHFDLPGETQAPPVVAKILVAGGFGVGKTTLVGAISEIRPLRTEEDLSHTGVGIDYVAGVEKKTTTTVAMDFGRITFPSGVVLYLFGTPGQERFWFMWDDLAFGAIGAVVLADTRRLEDCFAAVDYFERREIPFVIAANCFDGAHRYESAEIRVALNLDPDVPVLLCDARVRESVKEVLIASVTHSLTQIHTHPEPEPSPLVRELAPPASGRPGPAYARPKLRRRVA